MRTEIVFRRLRLDELGRVAEIDRTERIDAIYVQKGRRLDLRYGDFNASAWFPEGDGEHSVAAQQRACEHYVAAGGVAVGAFAGERLVGVGIVVPHLRPGMAQLAYLHVSNGRRGRGIGSGLVGRLEELAREAGNTSIAVSATPSLNTVRFYERRGYETMAEPLPELYEVEPEDVHMLKSL